MTAPVCPVQWIADSYFGYCKKEVKTQISMSANLFGYAEEEHAGGAVAFPTYHLGDHFEPGTRFKKLPHTFRDTVEAMGESIEQRPEGYAIDQRWNNILYLPENARISMPEQKVSWENDSGSHEINLLREHTYVYPSGFRVKLERHPAPAARSWRLIGTMGTGPFCHKPCTVSGGGKSEISKPFQDAFLYRSFFIRDFDADMKLAESIINRDYSDRFRPELNIQLRGRALLSPERSLGSVVKLLTTSSAEYTDAYNEWLESIPDHIRSLVFLVKRLYTPEMGDDWMSVFSVDMLNGNPGIELKYNNRKVATINARIGYDPHHDDWRTFKLRQDFIDADMKLA